MSADEDTELRDLVAQTLESNGTLGKLRAQLRASVFLALEDQENGQHKTPFLNKELTSFLSTREGRLTVGLVQEFLEFFNLEFTLAVFKPETGVNEQEKRSSLMKELSLQNESQKGPLLANLLRNSCNSTDKHTSLSSGDHGQLSNDISHKQIEDARIKFEEYDKDNSGTIEKDELRELFLDLFPDFHRNMLDRYVNDEFKAVDKDFSNSIDFEEFLGLYKRLILLCRTVASGDSAQTISSESKEHIQRHERLGNHQQDTSDSAFPNRDSCNELKNEENSNRNGSDVDEDPFFDDVPTSSVNFNTLSNELEKNKENQQKSKENGDEAKAKMKSSKGGMSSLDGLPSLNAGQTVGPSSEAPPDDWLKASGDDLNGSDLENNLRDIDRNLKDFNIDSQNDDYEYEDDFSPDHSLSLKSPRSSKTANKPENGSVAEEIDDEEIDEDISIEADDLLHSEKSGFDDLTTDQSISQADGGFDYMEDPMLP